MSEQAARTTRLEARISPDSLAAIRRAAEIQGRSVSDFVASAAWEAAQKAIGDAQIIRLCLEDQKAFAEAILNPPPPTEAMQRAQAEYERRVTQRP